MNATDADIEARRHMNATDPDIEARPHRILGRASIVAAGTAYQQVLMFVTGLLIARVIGAAEYGIFALARRLIDIATILTRLGLDAGLQRLFGEARADVKTGAARIVLQRVRLIADCVALLPVLVVALGAGRLLEDHIYELPGFANVLMVLSLALPFLTDLAILRGAYRGILNLTPSVLVESVVMPTVRLLLIIALFLLGWRLWAVVAGTSVAAFIASAVLALRAHGDFGTKGNPSDYRWTDTCNVIAYSSVLAVGVLVGTLTSTMDILILGRFAAAEVIGQYSLVKTLLVLMGVFGIAFSQGLGALVAERFRRNEIDAIVRVMALTIRWTALCTLPVFAVFLLWGAQISMLFGESFAIAQPVVAWLAVGQFIFSVFSPSGWALSMTGRQGIEVAVLSMGLLSAAILCMLLIPVFGQLGAAIATCASVAVANTARLYFVRRLIGRLPFDADVLLIAAVGLGLAILCNAAVAIAGIRPGWATLACISVYLPAYIIAAWLFLLRPPEQIGIRRALGSTAKILFCRAGT